MKCKLLYLSLMSICLTMVFAALSYAEIPREINYQGYLTNPGGSPINGTVNMQFSLYGALQGGAALWSESQDVSVNNGIYNVRLGIVTPLNLLFNQQYYLGIQVGTDSEMTPRQPLTSSPYALGNFIATVLAACNCSEDATRIQEAINSLPLTGGTVYLKAGTYMLTQGIHINKSNVTLLGEQGTFLRLGNQVQQPVLLIGTDKANPSYPGDMVRNIHVSHFEIDGNQLDQASELDPNRTWIRNNGIDVRMVDQLWIEDMNIHDARSGGIVVSWNSHKVFISNVLLHHNYFDGVALYTSDDIVVSNLLAYENVHGAGISLDAKLKHVSFQGGSLKNNGDVGIFARDSEDISFHNLMVTGNGNHGCFLSHVEENGQPVLNSGVKRFFFQGCSFLNNTGKGFVLASTASESPSNVIIGCLFSGNAGDIQDDTGVLGRAAIISQ